MSVQVHLTGEVARLEFDDSFSAIVIWGLLALFIATIFLFFTPLQGLSVGMVLVAPVAAAIWLVHGAPPKRTLRIDRNTLSISGSKNGKVIEHKVRAFQSLQLLHIRIPQGSTQHQVRILTSDGPLLVTAFSSRSRADELAAELARWLNVKVVDGGQSGMFNATLGCIRIWR